MKITNNLNNTSLTKNTSAFPDFLLTNKIGGYCLLGKDPSSRYQGIFTMHNSDMIKIIENIYLKEAGPIKEIKNKFSSVKRKRTKKDITEKFFMPYGYDALVYELNKTGEIEITLDIRRSYSNPEFQRIYKITKTRSGIIISYKHPETDMFLVIRSDSKDIKILDRWIKREYSFDKERNTHPSEKWVYKALKIKANKIVFSFFPKKKQAVEEAEYVFRHSKRLYEHQKIYVSNIKAKKPKDLEIKMAKKCAISSLNKLLVNLDGEKKTKGIFAGLPWFFQFWTRDELISTKAILLNGQERETKDILLKNLDLLKKGFLPNISMIKNNRKEFKKKFKRIEKIVGIESGNADSVGWLFKRIEDSLYLFNSKEKEKIKTRLISAINNISKNLMKDDLIYNAPKQTWMDSEWEEDNREGFRIEIQALFLNMLKLAYNLTKDEKYFKKEQEMRNTIRKKFWDGKTLSDGLEDFTIRPNIFIAAYIYPELLSKKEWTICFKNIIPRLWLPWGGLSSIDKKHHLFCKNSTGENRQSYHRGDSWYWINNLTALVLYRTDKKTFSRYIEKIVYASTKEILYSGAIGHHAEVSSASKMQSRGCFAQAWSAAMFIELIDEM